MEMSASAQIETDPERAAFADSSRSVNGDGRRRRAIQMRLRLPNTYTGAVAPVACFAVLRLPAQRLRNRAPALIPRAVIAMIDSTRIRMEVRAAHRIVVTLIAQPTRHGWRGTYAGQAPTDQPRRSGEAPKSGTCEVSRRASGTVCRTVGSSRLRSSRSSATGDTTLNVSCSAWDCASGGRRNDRYGRHAVAGHDIDAPHRTTGGERRQACFVRDMG